MGQPGHPLVSHLGVSNVWYAPVASIKGDFHTFKLSQLLRLTIPLFFKFSIIRIFHLFYPLLFNYIPTLRSLPHSISWETYFKYHRSKTIIDVRTGIKYNYMLRVGYPKLTVSEVRILRSSRNLLIFFSFQNYMKLVHDIFNFLSIKKKIKNLNTIELEAYNVLFLLNLEL